MILCNMKGMEEYVLGKESEEGYSNVSSSGLFSFYLSQTLTEGKVI